MEFRKAKRFPAESCASVSKLFVVFSGQKVAVFNFLHSCTQYMCMMFCM